MAFAAYKNGHPVNVKVVEGLRTHHSVKILWWRHSLNKSSFIRERYLECERQAPLTTDDFVVLTSTGAKTNNGHGYWMSYRTVSRAELSNAHPRCQACQGAGVHTLSYFGNTTDYTCSCLGGMSYTRIHLGSLREVRLDRYEVVVATADRGWGEEIAELIGKFTSNEAAETEAQKRRAEPRFYPGTRYYSGRSRVVGVRVVERPLPSWA